jgi:hypothetical protein
MHLQSQNKRSKVQQSSTDQAMVDRVQIKPRWTEYKSSRGGRLGVLHWGKYYRRARCGSRPPRLTRWWRTSRTRPPPCSPSLQDRVTSGVNSDKRERVQCRGSPFMDVIKFTGK